MKSKSLAGLLSILLSLFVISCDWFKTNAKPMNENPLIGKWQLDSLKPDYDSSIVFAFIGMAMKDPEGVQFEFKKDTLSLFQKMILTQHCISLMQKGISLFRKIQRNMYIPSLNQVIH
jgi:hypothetical protein